MNPLDTRQPRSATMPRLGDLRSLISNGSSLVQGAARRLRTRSSVASRMLVLIGILTLGAIGGFGGAHAVITPSQIGRLTQYRSVNGVLDVTLDARAKTIELAGVKLEALVFNGDYAGPVLRVRPGDLLKIRLQNHMTQLVNLHFHGSHASPLGQGDNIHAVVRPDEQFDYQLRIPRDQPPGLYWYHAHIHGEAEQQINRGLSGAMVVEGLDAKVAEAKGRPERLFVLKTFADPDNTSPAMKPLHGVVQSINGETHGRIELQQGDEELWRFSNESANDYYHLSLKGVRFRVVAIDGYATNSDADRDVLDIPPAGRVEAIVRFDHSGTFSLKSGATLTGLGKSLSTSRELAEISIAPGADSNTSRPLSQRAPQAPDLAGLNIKQRRDLVFSQKPGEEVYLINGRTYEHSRIDLRIPLGSVEEWTIRNDTDDMHVFHIHQAHFQVMSINGEAVPYDGRQDTVRIPERGAVTIRIAFTDPNMVGRFLYHCHVLKHEDKGMMANIEIYNPYAWGKPPRQDLFGFPICQPKSEETSHEKV